MFGKNLNGKIPSLFLKYKIIKQAKESAKHETEIRTLCNWLKIEKYIAHPHIYEKHRELILPLNTFLTKNSKELEIQISKNERAYQIWNDEKILDNSLCKSMIKWNDLEDKLNYYLTPEPFFDYIHTKKENMNILIVENKDTWYTLRKRISHLKNECFLCNIEIDGLVYGEGNKITKPNALKEYETQVIQRKCSFFYWGDLDYTGIEMYERVVEQNRNVQIRLFTPIYEKMIEAKKIDQFGKIKHKQNTNIPLALFLHSFNEIYQEKIKSILSKNCYIPQEIINAATLENLWKEKENL